MDNKAAGILNLELATRPQLANKRVDAEEPLLQEQLEQVPYANDAIDR